MRTVRFFSRGKKSRQSSSTDCSSTTSTSESVSSEGSKMQHIQQELVLHILSYFNSSPCSPSDATTLYSAALTCRNWYTISIELLYTSPNPQSYITLKALHNTLTNFNPSLTRHVKNLHMPIYTTWFSTSCSKRMAWRGKTVLEICDYRPDAEEEVREYVTMSQTDYQVALRLYEEIAAVCDELDRGSMPVSQSMDPRIHWSDADAWDDLGFGTGIGNTGSIRSMKELTLSPLVFPDKTKIDTSSPKIHHPLFPNLTKLTLLNLIMLYPLSIILHPDSLPSLTTLHIDGLSSPYSVFVEMLKPMGAQLKTLGIRRCIFYRTDNDHDDIDEDDDYLSETISGEAIPPSVTTLHLEASATSEHHRPQSVLRPSSHTEGVTHLVLQASHPSTWIELRAFQNLESLEVVYRPSSSRCYYSRQKYYQHAFRMADAIGSLIKTQSQSRGGKFKSLSIHWTIKTYKPIWSSPDPEDDTQTENEEVENALVLGYCLSRRCALYGVTLNWKLNTTQDDFFCIYPEVPPYKERNRHRWARYPPRSEAAREKGGSGIEKLKRKVVPWADSALARVGFISY